MRKRSPTNGKIVLKLYGRYCNASKFAGEIDALERVADVKRRYPIDEDRILDIGFSMGGASAWQFATHYTDLFAAASPGAGFAESAQFLHIHHDEAMALPWYERVLWHLYDCTDYAVNLNQLPTIAYAGEIDPQKQSSDIMMSAMAAEGLTLQRLIGPKTKHAYEKQTKAELDRRLDKLVAIWPQADCRKRFASRPGRCSTTACSGSRSTASNVTGCGRGWMAIFVQPTDCCATGFTLKTHNVTELTLTFRAGRMSGGEGEAAERGH